jgi:hypothetical protein
LSTIFFGPLAGGLGPEFIGDDLAAADCFDLGAEVDFSTLVLRAPLSNPFGFGLVISLMGILTLG